MKLYYISDLHTEINGVFEFEKHIDDYLVLVGDIGKPFEIEYFQTLQNASKSFNKVFLVCGNNELYTVKKHTITQIKNKIYQICATLKNVIFLDNDYYDIDKNTRIVGSILWSNIPEEKIKLTISRNKDCSTSYWSKFNCREMFEHDEKENLQQVLPLDLNEYYIENIQFLEDQINKIKNKNLIICTHYLPTFKIIEDSDIKFLFASNLEYLIKKPVKYWICGHSHYNKDLDLNGVALTMNCYGYTSQDTKYVDGKYIQL